MPSSGEKHPYGFPFRPYSVQTELMDVITRAIDARSFGLFESPTGTGKTLSVICATLSWLVDHRLDPNAHLASKYPGQAEEPEIRVFDTEPDWVAEHAERKAVSSLRATLDRRSRDFSCRVGAVKSHEQNGVRRKGVKAKRLGSAPSAIGSKRSSAASSGMDGKFLLVSEPLPGSTAQGMTGDEDFEFFTEPSPGESTAERQVLESDAAPRLRVIFATRTHTQLTQFVAELRKTAFASSIEQPVEIVSDFHELGQRQLPLSVVLFGSRKVMCINEDVRNLPTASAVSERCRELTAGSTQSSAATSKKRGREDSASKCCYKDATVEEIMRDMVIVRPHDIEDLASTGKEMRGCPYFATRAAISAGAIDVLGVPYSAVLHAQTRESLGITIDSQTVVVFDEGHNVVDAVNDIHSSTLSRGALEATMRSLEAYQQKYSTRLSPQNLFNVNQVLTTIRGLLSLLVGKETSTTAKESDGSRSSGARVLSPSSLIFEAGIDNLNLFQLSSFIRSTKLLQKLCGFIDAGMSDDSTSGAECDGRGLTSSDKSGVVERARRRARNGFSAFEAFLIALSSDTSSGRIAVYPESKVNSASPDGANVYMKFFILDPGTYFTSAMAAARSVILVGGTLSPREALKSRLFAGLSTKRTIAEFECGHVIPPSNLTAMVCSTGPSNVSLEFTRHTRNDTRVIDELGSMLLNVSMSTPGGVVVFFASYSFMSSVFSRWSAAGLLAKLESLKPVFKEERGDVRLFETYSAAVLSNQRQGAILLSVLGGRLSEGINFSDDLGRAVVVVGMPFANANDLEMREILRSLPDTRCRSEYLENACMITVNQAIGRAIRHRSDYAAIILCDRRYSRAGTQSKLPKFVRQSMTQHRAFASIQDNLVDFFRKHV